MSGPGGTGGRARGGTTGALAATVALLALLQVVVPAPSGAPASHNVLAPSSARGPAPSAPPAQPHPADPMSPWVNLTASLTTFPSPREGAQIAYDPINGRILLFGGLAHNRSLGDTWEFSAGQWSNRTASLSGSPPSRYKGGLVYDSADAQMILFGGNSGPVYRNDTWSYNGTAWTAIHPTISPGPREDVAMADDPYDGYVLLFGGESPSARLTNDTWSYGAGQWTNRSASIVTAPAAREAGGLTYDGADHYVLLFSGKLGSGGLFRDTWTYRGGAWTNITSTLSVSPPAREAMMISYDFVDGFVLLFGGFHFPNSLSDEWRFLNGQWSSETPSTGPPPRLDAALSYYPNGGLGFVLLFGGRSSPLAGATLFGDTWSYKVPVTVVVASDAATIDLGQSANLTLNVSGGYLPYTSTGWSGLPSSCVGGSALSILCTPTVAAGYSIVGNAVDSTGFNGTSVPFSFQVNPDPSVIANESGTVGQAPFVVDFNATVSGGTAPFALDWTFGDGLFGSGTPVSHTFSAGHFAPFVTLTDARGLTAMALLAPIDVAPPPPALAVTLVATPNTGPAPLVVAFNATATGGTSPYTYFWTLGVPGATARSSGFSYTYTSPGSYAALVTVNDSAGGSLSKSVAIDVAPASPLVASATAVPSSGTAPLTVTFAASASGGTTPYTYGWGFGPTGAIGAGATVSYTYLIAGDFNATLTVTDADGSTATAVQRIHVLGPLNATFSWSVGVPYCSGSAPVADVNLNAAVTGGSGVSSYLWAIGSAGENGPSPAVVLGAGVTSVTLQVTDTAGTVASQTQNVTVPGVTCAAPGVLGATGGSWLVFALIGIVAAVIAVELVLLFRGNRGRRD